MDVNNNMKKSMKFILIGVIVIFILVVSIEWLVQHRFIDYCSEFPDNIFTDIGKLNYCEINSDCRVTMETRDIYCNCWKFLETI